MGNFLWDGADYFQITEDIYNQIKNIGPENLKHDLEYLKSYREGEGSISIDRDTLPERFSVESFDYDYHSTDNTEDFYKRYVLGEE